MTAATQGRLLGSLFTPAVCVRVTGMGLKQMVQQRVEGGLHAVTFVTLAVCTLRWLLLDPPTLSSRRPPSLCRHRAASAFNFARQSWQNLHSYASMYVYVYSIYVCVHSLPFFFTVHLIIILTFNA